MPNKPWQTWVAHAAFAALVTWAFSFIFPVGTAALLAWWGYMWRELDQVFRKLLKGKGINWLDATLDVVAPALSAVLVAWWLS